MTGQPSPAAGPFATERQASAEIRNLYDALPRPVPAGELTRLNAALLTRACAKAGVELGSYDSLILRWLSGWEPATTGVVAGLVSRAYEAGRAGRP